MNAKIEFLEEIKDKELVCAKIGLDKTHFGNKIKWNTLRDGYSQQEFDEFLEKLNLIYDDGFGSQELFGIILFKDSYSDRHEYDGSEEWRNHKMPTIEYVLNLK
jgi:hypothetical protein